MKKHLLLLTFFNIVCLGSLYAQLNINSFFNPRPGETKRFNSEDTTGITPGNSGPMQTWNYSNMTYTGDSSVQIYVSPSSTPYFGTFPTANVASYYPGYANNCSYYKCTDTSFEYLGNRSGTYRVIYTDPIKNLRYPLNYGQSFTDTYRILAYLDSNLTQKSSGTLTMSYDGYGTLILPSGTAVNVARLKSVQNQWDTNIMGGNTTIANIKDTTWYWAKSNYRYALLQIEVSWSNYLGFYSGYKWVGAIPNINSVGIENITNEIPLNFKLEQNYPNPFNPSTTIKYQIPKDAKVSLKVFDGLGREVATLLNSRQNTGIYQLTWDAENYSNGVYFCRLIAEPNDGTDIYTETQKMILIK